MATKKRNVEEIQEELDVVQDQIDEIDEELEEQEEKPVKKAKKSKKGELKVVEPEETEEKKSLKEKAKEFGEEHPKMVKWGKRVATGLTVVAAAVLGYKAGQDSMIDYDEVDDLDILSDEE